MLYESFEACRVVGGEGVVTRSLDREAGSSSLDLSILSCIMMAGPEIVNRRNYNTIGREA